MPKVARYSYYAVVVGRRGPRIYSKRHEAQAATISFPGAKCCACVTEEEAIAHMNVACGDNWQSFAKTTDINLLQPIVGPPLPNRPSQPLPRLPLQPRSLAYGNNSQSCSPSTTKARSNVPYKRVEVSHESSVKSKLENEEIVLEFSLSHQQKAILSTVAAGASTFITGAAGTGKSVLLQAIVKALRKQYSAKDAVVVTATTGIAASLIKGSTLHSWAGCGLAKASAADLARKISQRPDIHQRWRLASVLIIDEVSMLDGDLFDKFEQVARMVRACERPFGGIQLVCVGDFFQLPPVPDLIAKKIAPILCFNACAWQNCIHSVHFLDLPFRQAESDFVQLLSEVRTATLTKMSETHLTSLARPLLYSDGLEPTRLFPKRWQVQSENARRLAMLQGKPMDYSARDESGSNPVSGWQYYTDPVRLSKALDSSTIAESQLTLKTGAQVLLIRNLAKYSLVNGSIGTIIAFLGSEEVRAAAKAELAGDSDGCIDESGGYRVHLKDVGDIEIASVRASDGVIKKRIREGDFSTKCRIPSGSWPVVQFKGGLKLLLFRIDFTIENSRGDAEAIRYQVPLIPSYSLTIHKCQGQTLERVIVDLGEIFEAGQAYVALSRAISMSSLQILNFKPYRIRALPAVLEYYRQHSVH